MNSKKTLGIILEFGFHDIKKFIHSGFAQKLSQYYNIVWLSLDKGSIEFDAYFKNTGFPLVYLNPKDFLDNHSITESRNQSVRRHWMKIKNVGSFHNYSNIGAKTFMSYFLGNGLVKTYYERKTLKEVKERYFSKILADIFEKYEVETLLGINFSSSFVKSAYLTGNQKKIKTWYLVNSWKDLYTNNFIPFDFLDGIFVWSEQMKKDYMYHMPYLNPGKIHISGNPTFDILRTSKPCHPRSYYSQKYGISEKAEWLLYTMMPPGLVNNEIDTAFLVAEEILKSYSYQEKVIILRRNPNHYKADFINRKVPANLVIADHYCTYDKIKDMIVQSPEGEQEWIDLLHHCVLNISVPSTVTLEFLTLNKPVINIVFGPNGMPDERLRQHFEAGFYKPMFRNRLIKKALTIIELVPTLKLCYEKENFDLKPTGKLSLASDNIINTMINVNGA